MVCSCAAWCSPGLSWGFQRGFMGGETEAQNCWGHRFRLSEEGPCDLGQWSICFSCYMALAHYFTRAAN